jgi:WD40 repeat protein
VPRSMPSGPSGPSGLVGRASSNRVVAPAAPAAPAAPVRSVPTQQCILPPCRQQQVLLSGDVGVDEFLCDASGHGLKQSVTQAHGSAVTALEFLNGNTLLSAGMDKTVCLWQIDESNLLTIAKRIILSGGPAHSVLVDDPESGSIVLGLHNASVLSLVSMSTVGTPTTSGGGGGGGGTLTTSGGGGGTPTTSGGGGGTPTTSGGGGGTPTTSTGSSSSSSSPFLQDMQYSVLESNLCGWVRDLASNGRYLFISSCNEIRQVDGTTKKNRTFRLDKGDILSLVCTKDKVFAGTVDGSLFGFAIDPKNGNLELACARPKAHAGRITDLQIHRGLLVSCSYDGSVKSWCMDGLEIVGLASNVHGADGRVLALAQHGSLLYSGGSDGTVRVFDPNVLEEIGVIEPEGIEDDEGIRTLGVSKGLEGGGALVLGTSCGKLVVSEVFAL